MSATFGVTVLYSTTAPTGTHIQELVHKSEVRPVTVENLLGVTVKATTEKMNTKTLTMKVKGGADITAVTAGAGVIGTFKILSIKVTEKNKDYAESEITYKTYASTAS